MNVYFILKNVINNLYKRRLNFLLITIVSGITIFLLDMVFMISEESYYHIRVVREILNQKETSINIRIIWDARNLDYEKNIAGFDAELEEMFGDAYGKFMEMNMKFQKEESSEEREMGVLYIDKSMLDLCDVSLNQGKMIERSKDECSYIEAYVGYGLKEEYPIGTVLENSYTGSKTKIVGVLEQDSNWLPTILFGSTEAKINLDDMIVSEMDHSIFETSELFYGNISTSIYLKCDSAKQLERKQEIIQEIAKKHQILCYSDTIEQLIEKEKENNRKVFQSIGILTIFVVILSFIALLASSAADIYNRRYDIGVMYIHGIRKIHIFMMTWLENLLKLLIAFGVAVFLYGRNLSGDSLLIHSNIVIRKLLIFLFMISILISGIACLVVNRKDITNLISSVE